MTISYTDPVCILCKSSLIDPTLAHPTLPEKVVYCYHHHDKSFEYEYLCLTCLQCRDEVVEKDSVLRFNSGTILVEGVVADNAECIRYSGMMCQAPTINGSTRRF